VQTECALRKSHRCGGLTYTVYLVPPDPLKRYLDRIRLCSCGSPGVTISRTVRPSVARETVAAQFPLHPRAATIPPLPSTSRFQTGSAPSEERPPPTLKLRLAPAGMALRHVNGTERLRKLSVNTTALVEECRRLTWKWAVDRREVGRPCLRSELVVERHQRCG
jgi:hypothetical protein